MKIMVGVDMEGITGVCSKDYITDPRMSAEASAMAVSDVNACVQGLVDAGVDDIYVWDNHYVSFNHDFTKLHGGAKYRRGGAANGLRWQDLDGTYDGLILLGYHAMAGTPRAVLDHTMSSEGWHCFKVNGQALGEVGIDAALAGAVGVPVIMVSGDDKLCIEAKALLGEPIQAACVKWGHARHGATCLPVEKTAALIRAAACAAAKNAHNCKTFDAGSPAVVELTFKHTWQADGQDLRLFQGRRLDGYTVQWTCPDLASWMGGTMG